MQGVLEWTDEEVVSTDFVSYPASSILDVKACIQLHGTYVKLVTWYDNEWGYSNRVLDLMLHMHGVETGTASALSTAAVDSPGAKEMQRLLRSVRADRDKFGKDLDNVSQELKDLFASPDFLRVSNEKFDKCDTTGDGRLRPPQLAPLLEELAAGLPVTVTDADCHAFCDIFDTGRTGYISREEFHAFVRFLFVLVSSK